MGEDSEAVPKRTPFAAKRREESDDVKKSKKEKKEKKSKRDREGGGGGDSEKEKHEANKRPKKGDEGEGKKGKGDKKDSSPEITTLFFGQMPYDTKVEHIVPWLKTILRREGCAEDVLAVRLAGGGGTNKKFKGFAFVDFKTQKAAKKARKFHDTLFRGRKVSIEPCSRPEYVTPKSERKKQAAETADGGDDSKDNSKKQLKQLTDSDVVDDMVKEACENAMPAGVITEHDFDSQLRSFLSLLPKDVLAAALLQIQKQAPKAPKRRVPYFMGIIKKVSKQHWERSDAKKKRDAGQLEGDSAVKGKEETTKPKQEEETEA